MPIKLVVLFVTVALAGCALAQESSLVQKDTCQPPEITPSIAGCYKDNFKGKQIVSRTVWISQGQGNELLFHNCTVDETDKYIVSKNDGYNQYNPNKYSRFEWTKYEGSLYYCQQVYDADTLQNATNFSMYPKANSTNPNTGGCGVPKKNFPWTKMTLCCSN